MHIIILALALLLPVPTPASASPCYESIFNAMITICNNRSADDTEDCTTAHTLCCGATTPCPPACFNALNLCISGVNEANVSCTHDAYHGSGCQLDPCLFPEYH